MIYGIGTDIAAVARLTAMYERHGERALEKILAPEEMTRCLAAQNPGRYLAKRFAAKEALSKALGTGIRAPALMPAMMVANDELGKPYFTFAPELAAYMQARKLVAHLSISDEKEFAVAFVVLETTE